MSPERHGIGRGLALGAALAGLIILAATVLEKCSERPYDPAEDRALERLMEGLYHC